LTMAQGCELIFDAVAGPASRALIQSSRRGGRYIIHGMLDRRPMNVHAGVLMKRLLTLQGYTLDQTLTETESRQSAIAALEQLASEATVQPNIDKRFSLREAPQALDYLATNQHLGKVLVDCRLHKK
ncbi:MAG: zinc-binding dehydrogenase, partial [Oleiphilaceae bacterium]|nr:zinc-binding dehydrogenase [Oleiphilaceae bacterium]